MFLIKWYLIVFVFIFSFSAQCQEHDMVIYGGTSAGIAAAIQGSRMGKTVLLIEPTSRLGGLTTGGFGATDIGNKQVIGGISREFYQNIKAYYEKPENWKWQKAAEYQESECSNLLVPVCVSATHIAYGSIRMEPVFMVLGQSAATAAALAIDKKIALQKIPYSELKEKLIQQGQKLSLSDL